MITLSSAINPTNPEVLKAPGGFAWWYVDLVDEHGNGVVVIWSFGLPFIPGYAHAARQGSAQLPTDRPATTLSAYSGGRCVYYDFVVHKPEEVEWNPRLNGVETWRFAESTFESTDLPDGQRSLQISFDRAIPGSRDRLRGSLSAQGHLRRGGSDDLSDAHVWCPMLLACPGKARLSSPSWHLGVDGRAYHDRNAADRPLDRLGIQRWWWGRLSLPDCDLVWYRLQPDDPAAPLRELVLRVDKDGTATTCDAQLHLGAEVPGRYGLSSPSSVEFRSPSGAATMVLLEQLVDDGPFYQRHIVTGLCDGQRGHGVAELVVPERVDQTLHRPFVRMAVRDEAGPNSLFLPLFSGPSAGRFGRLPWWWGAAG